jgi:hypothetical protein
MDIDRRRRVQAAAEPGSRGNTLTLQHSMRRRENPALDRRPQDGGPGVDGGVCTRL